MKSIEEIKEILKNHYKKDKKCWIFSNLPIQLSNIGLEIEAIEYSIQKSIEEIINIPNNIYLTEAPTKEEKQSKKKRLNERQKKYQDNINFFNQFNIEYTNNGCDFIIYVYDIKDLLNFYNYINEYEEGTQPIEKDIPQPQQKENNSFVLVTNTNTITPTQQSKFATDETIRKYFTGTVEAWENLFNSKCIQPATEENGLQIQCLTKEKSKYKDLGALLLSLQELGIYRKAEKGQGKLPLYSKLEELNIFVDKEKEPIKKINRLTYTNKKRKKITITSFSKTLTIRNCSKNAEEILRTISNIKNLQEH